MFRTFAAATLLVLAAASPAMADETQAVGVKCTSLTTSCSSNFAMTSATHLISITCDWSATTVQWIEIDRFTSDGNTLLDKQYFALSADERAAEAASRVIDRGIVASSSQGMAINTSDKLKLRLNSTTSQTDKGTCYVTGR